MNENELELSKHYSVADLLKFSAVPVITIVLASLYMIVDALFIANFTSSTSFAAANLAMPFVMIFPAVGFMMGGGGNALIGKLLGEQQRDRAISVFSMIVEFTVVASLMVTVLGQLLLVPFLRWQGADGMLLSEAVTYGRIVLLGTTGFALQYAFQLFLITSGNEARAFIYTLAAGVTNIVLDALLILGFGMGVEGAAVGTIAAQAVGAILPLTYYCSRKKKESLLLYFLWTRIEWKPIWQAAFNGISEMIENVSESLIGLLYNLELMRIYGELGVDAYGALMYVQLIFTLIFVGYNESVIPLISFQYGARNRKELKGLYLRSLAITGMFSLLFFGISELLAVPVSALFADGNEEMAALTVQGFRIGSFSLIAMGVAMFIPALFTALNNGLVSGILTVFEMLVFPAACVLIMAPALGMDGIWQSLNASWALSLIICAAAVWIMRKRYNFFVEENTPETTIEHGFMR